MSDMHDSTEVARRPAPQVGRPFSDVICGVDGTRRSYTAVEQAAVLAGGEGHLTLLAVTAVSGSGAYRTATIGPERAGHLLERAGRLARAAGVAFDSEEDPAGPAPQVVVERARSHDLLALGAPAGSWLGAALVDGVSSAAIAELATPLLLAKAMPSSDLAFARRLLVADDGLDHSDALVDLAISIANCCDAHVTLLHAGGVEYKSHPHRLEAQVERIRAAVPGGCELMVQTDSPAEAIVGAAVAADASLIVMGSRRVSGLRAVGSAARHVVREADCSVLLVPPGPVE